MNKVFGVSRADGDDRLHECIMRGSAAGPGSSQNPLCYAVSYSPLPLYIAAEEKPSRGSKAPRTPG
jgi:hypothetical protein